MAIYSVKLVDHSGSSTSDAAAICASIVRVMGLAFVGTSDSLTITWGTGSASDNLVLHFVTDIAHSYLRGTWPGMTVDPNAGGHTPVTARRRARNSTALRPGARSRPAATAHLHSMKRSTTSFRTGATSTQRSAAESRLPTSPMRTRMT